MAELAALVHIHRIRGEEQSRGRRDREGKSDILLHYLRTKARGTIVVLLNPGPW
jgi:hypothetical protein